LLVQTLLRFAVAPLVYSSFPVTGPAFRATLVNITGQNFLPNNASQCRFGSALVRATVVSSSLVTCRSPLLPPGVVILEFTNNGQDFTRSLMPYTFTGEIQLAVTFCVCKSCSALMACSALL
jgi:hypothetical protein